MGQGIISSLPKSRLSRLTAMSIPLNVLAHSLRCDREALTGMLPAVRLKRLSVETIHECCILPYRANLRIDSLRPGRNHKVDYFQWSAISNQGKYCAFADSSARRQG